MIKPDLNYKHKITKMIDFELLDNETVEYYIDGYNHVFDFRISGKLIRSIALPKSDYSYDMCEKIFIDRINQYVKLYRKLTK